MVSCIANISLSFGYIQRQLKSFHFRALCCICIGSALSYVLQ